MGMKTINGYEAKLRTRLGPVQIDRYSSRSREAEDSIYWVLSSRAASRYVTKEDVSHHLSCNLL
jgi:hypothetical protein